MLLQRSALD